ncbi:MAG TPA: hypothetical protein PKL65_09370 [Bacteroidales bacterium]|nr:hypothetical protein [Bacteroidales bacterium]
MKTQAYKSGIILVLFILLTSGAIRGQQAVKDFHKEYTAGPGTTLDVSNRYGNVTVETTDGNMVIIDVRVTVDLPSRERAEKLLSYIDVNFAESDNVITAKTVIDDKFSFSGWGGSNRKFSINYKIKMPARINFTLANKYGNTDLDEIHGLVNLDIKYGNLTAENLSRGNEKPLNALTIAYGNASISSASWLDINSRYVGNLRIDRIQALLISSKYSKIRLGETSSVVGDSKYDNFRISKINNLVLDAGYSDIVVETLLKKLKFEGGYGALTVGEIPAGFELIDTDTRYIGVKLGIDDNASYKLDARLSFGNLKFNEENYRNQKRIAQSTSNEIQGIVGNETDPTSVVKVHASYGSVRLTR